MTYCNTIYRTVQNRLFAEIHKKRRGCLKMKAYFYFKTASFNFLNKFPLPLSGKRRTVFTHNTNGSYNHHCIKHKHNDGEDPHAKQLSQKSTKYRKNHK